MTAAVLPLAVTMGEPAGIGGEIVLKAWLRRRAGRLPFFAIDDPDRLRNVASRLELPISIREIEAPESAGQIFGESLPVLAEPLRAPSVPGRLDPANAPAVISAIDRAVAPGSGAAGRRRRDQPDPQEVPVRCGFPPSRPHRISGVPGRPRNPPGNDAGLSRPARRAGYHP